MSRMTQAIAYINSESISTDWIKTNLTHIEVTPELKDLRKRIKSKPKK